MQEIIFLNIFQKELFTSLPTGFGRFSKLDESYFELNFLEEKLNKLR